MPELLKSCIELHDALAAAMRVIVRHDLAREFLDEAHSAGVEDGVGVRAQKAILDAAGAQL